jgi:prevent-host-death family protein
MPTVDILLAQTQLASLLEAASRGGEVIITQDGKPAAKLTPVYLQRKLREPGSMAGQIWIADDFDGPLPADIQAAFEDNA